MIIMIIRELNIKWVVVLLSQIPSILRIRISQCKHQDRDWPQWKDQGLKMLRNWWMENKWKKIRGLILQLWLRKEKAIFIKKGNRGLLSHRSKLLMGLDLGGSQEVISILTYLQRWSRKTRYITLVTNSQSVSRILMWASGKGSSNDISFLKANKVNWILLKVSSKRK